MGLQEFVEETGLADRARKTVEEHALFGRMLLAPLLDHGIHDLVGDQFPLVHVFAGEQPEGGAGLQMMTEKIAGGDVAEVEARAERGGVGAFAHTRGTD